MLARRTKPVWPDPWEEVRDAHTGQIYWWNPNTDETTAVGAPKPTSPVGIAATAAAAAASGGGALGISTAAAGVATVLPM